MSTTTDVLSLFKYDPVADADSTFNITQALNNNWDKLDAAILLAIAAAGAYNPEESYAVGDYCTYKGKLRKCSTAIPTGETWTEAHWTTTTVAAELAELSSQLSNRLRLPIAIPANADLNDYVSPGMYFCSANAQNVENIPPDSITGAFSLLVEYSGAYGNGCKQTFTEHNPGITYIRRMSDISAGHRSAWEPLSTATPPQEFDLPLADGWLPIDARYGAVYWKTQESIVNISLGLKSDHTVTNGEIIATIPAGFRPKKSLKNPSTVVNQNELLVHGYVDINRSDGTIQIYKITDQIKELCFPATSFLANG